jgi:hypothetical protein
MWEWVSYCRREFLIKEQLQGNSKMAARGIKQKACLLK